MDYKFNYGFIADFLRINGFNKADIMRALNTKDYSSITRYIEGEIAPPVESVLRISNYFGIPLAAWFFDPDNSVMAMRQPTEDSVIEPTIGFSEGNDKGGRKHCNPHVPDTDKRRASMPFDLPEINRRVEVVTAKGNNDDDDDAITPQAIEELQNEISNLHIFHEKEIDRIKALHDRDLLSEKKRHKKALKEAADRHAAERLQLIDIIKAQQETINRLTRGMKYQEPEHTMQIAAEPEPTDK